jgi:hypothetical protein
MTILRSCLRVVARVIVFGALAWVLGFIGVAILGSIWPGPGDDREPDSVTRGSCANSEEMSARYPAVARELDGLDYEGPFMWTEIRGRRGPLLFISGPMGLDAVRKWRKESGIETRYLEGGTDEEQIDLANKECKLFRLHSASVPGFSMNINIFSDGFAILAVYGRPDQW